MKNIYFITALVCILFMSSCGSLSFNDNLTKVVEGMTTKEVSELLGNPTHRRFDQGIEEWEYERAYTAEQNRIVLVNFVDGRVTALDSFYKPIRKTGTGNPPHKRETPPHK